MNTVTPKQSRSAFRRQRIIGWCAFSLGIVALLGFAVGSCVAHASPPTVNINDDWRVWGDVQARPIQAFDDGRALYLQLRNPSEPPAVMGPNGPLAYSLHGTYMVLPILPYLHLQYGPYRATVQSTGSAEGMPGVISVTSPVEVPQTVPMPVTAQRVQQVTPMVLTTVAPAVQVAPSSHVYGNITGASPTLHAVMGQIVATNTATGQRSTGISASGGDLAVPYQDAKTATTWNDRRGKRWTIRADGTAAGARAALESQSVCQSAKATCTIEYRGAPAGTLVISEKTA